MTNIENYFSRVFLGRLTIVMQLLQENWKTTEFFGKIYLALDNNRIFAAQLVTRKITKENEINLLIKRLTVDHDTS